jgi:hypothetical protein
MLYSAGGMLGSMLIDAAQNLQPSVLACLLLLNVKSDPCRAHNAINPLNKLTPGQVFRLVCCIPATVHVTRTYHDGCDWWCVVLALTTRL